MSIEPQMESDVPEVVCDGKIKRVSAAAADYLNKHWFIKSILQFLPSIWMPIFLTGLGKLWNLRTEDGLTFWGWFGVLAVHGLSLFVTLLSNFKRKRDAMKAAVWTDKVESKSREVNVYETVVDGEKQIEQLRMEKVIARIASEKFHSDEIKAFVLNTFSPEDHLGYITSEIRNCIERISKLRKRDFCVSLAVSMDDKEWEWINQREIAGCANLHDLISEGSTFFEISSGQKIYTYYNDKVEASQQKHYLMDPRDNSNKGRGSIICWEVSICHNGTKLAKLIMNISTYGKRLSSNPPATEELYKIVKDNILDQFENEIRLDLALHYLLAH